MRQCNFAFVFLGLVALTLHWHWHGTVDAVWNCERESNIGSTSANVETCGTELQTPSNLTYPLNGSYDNNEHCVWNVSSPDWRRIRAAFTKLDLQDDPSCGLDSIKVTTSAGVVGTYCSGSLPMVISQDDKLQLEFSSDGSGTGTGFSVQFTDEPGPVTATTCGDWRIKAGDNLRLRQEWSNYQPGEINYNCYWAVHAPPGQLVEARFSSLGLGDESVACWRGKLKVFSDAALIGSYCGKDPGLLSLLVSPGSLMKLQLHISYPVSANLIAEFSVVHPDSVVVQSFAFTSRQDAIFLSQPAKNVSLSIPNKATGQLFHEPRSGRVSITVKHSKTGKSVDIESEPSQSWVIDENGVTNRMVLASSQDPSPQLLTSHGDSGLTTKG